ncbi:MAG: substrate-binding domain-containing protein [Luteolibacter sp.]
MFLDLNGVPGHRLFSGVSRWAREQRGVVIRRWDSDKWRAPDFDLPIDGAIMQCSQPEDSRLAAQRGLPLINVSNFLATSACPRVASDDQALGRAVAGYFLRRGYRHFAYCGFAWHHASALRGAGFREEIERAGFSLAEFTFALSANQQLTFNSDQESERHKQWLRTLPKPCAIMGFSDEVALLVIHNSSEISCVVPDDFAVMGVDNDSFRTHGGKVALASADVGFERVGYEAAVALDAWLRHGRRPALDRCLRAFKLHARESSDRYAVEDEKVLAALDFIAENFATGTDVNAIAAASGLSRRGLERRFRLCLNRSVLKVVNEARLDKAQQLLAESEMAIKTVAQQAGFSDARHLCVAFQTHLKTSPSAFRKSRL